MLTKCGSIHISTSGPGPELMAVLLSTSWSRHHIRLYRPLFHLSWGFLEECRWSILGISSSPSCHRFSFLIVLGHPRTAVRKSYFRILGILQEKGSNYVPWKWPRQGSVLTHVPRTSTWTVVNTNPSLQNVLYLKYLREPHLSVQNRAILPLSREIQLCSRLVIQHVIV